MTIDKAHIAVDVDIEADEIVKFELSLALYEPPADVAAWLKRAYYSTKWDWQRCDGCTGVSEAHFPEGYKFPPCVGHDHDCDLATWEPDHKKAMKLRAYGDKMFYKANRAYGMSRVRAAGRWVGVRTYWLWIGQWKDWWRKR